MVLMKTLPLLKFIPYHIYNLSGKHLSIEDVVNRREKTTGNQSSYVRICVDN